VIQSAPCLLRCEIGNVLSIDLPDDSVDLVMCSPPYEAQRTYGIDFALRGEDWVAWAAQGFRECLRVCRGLVVWVVEGSTRQYRYSATPALLMADLHRSGVCLRKPPVYARVGIPGSGGPDWLRNDWEWCIAATKRQGKLPWSDNTAMGHPPKYAPGGDPSHRLPNGRRVTMLHTQTMPDGEKQVQGYTPPALANPGNIIKCHGGGGHMGPRLAHENEAPYPESLAEWFVRSFCPPGGTVLDPFSGSGTTAAVAIKHGRNAIAFDIRESMVELTKRRVAT
jgi:hypothetical protein